MKKFRFRLEMVLQYRQLVRQERLRDLMHRNMELQESLNRLAALESEELRSRLKENGIYTVQEIVTVGQYEFRLRALILSQRDRVAECRKRVDEAMAIYIEAAKEAEALVKLKERRQDQYREHADKEEAKFLDELAVFRGNERGKE